MKNRVLFFREILIIAMLLIGCSMQQEEAKAQTDPAKPTILVFYKTAGFYHESIPDGIAAIQKLGQENNIAVETSKDASVFSENNLKKYKAVVFLSTTQDVLNPQEQIAFEGYIKKGGGFVGIHAATDTEYDWPWYNQLVGAYFDGHPAVQKANILVKDKTHPSTAFLQDKWERVDEWYNFKNINPKVKVLATLDENSYKGGKNGTNHPVIWYHEFDGGRAFYTAGGHTPESYREPLFLQHLLAGIKYAMGK
ncbi:ThuA domain-containing protein [Adhaeribacter rhizoryzae]|uniref:ThuA domain-containing protein n=1 Tax=Adhaeribacter rhizoryzae TaxID=2607907 RepID=A0A5M6DJ07_9BACT|nr:ThuA domain-containing protein [Adhaeribacter rhizoryzae]KAA5547577.1 ThuA domain-containing protein [Adhaeribacter rhizoryzae]